ncbi:MAG: TraR/DksA C4-type zinc finger protein [Desulfocapsaceae bacterium]|nr:TraR/DksA C4-type zinc finger protein [Desulfocapsaceae bacterium]
MGEKDLIHLKDLLLRQRREILDRLQGLESDWQALSERDIEREEEAQKADLASLFDQFEERERQELDDIELALTKMVNVSYGICEQCRNTISLERLEVLPATRFCRRCEAGMEEKQKKPAILP